MTTLRMPNYEAESGWGPPADVFPNFSGLPFAPFSKRETINHIANWDPNPWQRRRNAQIAGRTKLGAEIANVTFVNSDAENEDTAADENKAKFKHVKSRSYSDNKSKKRRYRRKDTSKIAAKVAAAHTEIKNREHLKIQNAPESHRRRRRLNRRRRYTENQRPQNFSTKIQEHFVDVKDIWFRDQFDLRSTIPTKPRILLTAGYTHQVLNDYDQLSCSHTYPLESQLFGTRRFLSYQHKSASLDPYMIELMARENKQRQKFLYQQKNKSSSSTINKNSPMVFATDNVLTAIMCCTKSRYSYDIVISKVGNNIFLDERSKWLVTLNVDETSQLRPTWKSGLSINKYQRLAQESTEINHTFREQLLVHHQSRLQRKLQKQNPFLKDFTQKTGGGGGGGAGGGGGGGSGKGSKHKNKNKGKNKNNRGGGNAGGGGNTGGGGSAGIQQSLSSEAFVYKKFRINNDRRYNSKGSKNRSRDGSYDNNSTADGMLGDDGADSVMDDIDIVCRCTIDGHHEKDDQSWISIFSLNQYDNTKSKTLNWKKELNNRESSVLLTEINNNGFKCARWALKAYLVGAPVCKLGYIVRDDNYSTNKHVILGVKNISTKAWIHKNNLHPHLRDEWNILLKFLRVCQVLDDGRYCAVRAPLKQVFRFYSVTNDAFSREDGLPTLKHLQKLVANAKK